MESLVTLLEDRVQQVSKKIAFTFLEGAPLEENASLSYEALEHAAKAIAVQLQSYNARHERVLLIYKPGLDFIAAFWGCLYAGAIAVPAYPPRKNHHFERLQSILQSADAKFVLTTQQGLETFAPQGQQWPELACAQWIATDQLDLAMAPHWQRPEIQPEDLALLQYTSGSTGMPKGVMVQHNHLLANFQLIHDCFQDTADSFGVCWLPPYHDMGLIGGILQPIFAGASTVLMAPVSFLQRPLHWLEAISHYRASTAGGPNFAYALCAEAIKPHDCEGLDLSAWRVAFTGAEPIQAATLQRFTEKFAPFGFADTAFLPCYGMAESTLMVTGQHASAAPRVKIVETEALRSHRIIDAAPNQSQVTELVSCGAPVGDVRVEIVNPETQARCDHGAIGEIWVRSNSVAGGYWQQPELTQATFGAVLDSPGSGCFLRTGDLGFLDAGELFITGRLKELMIIRGRNYYPQDIEAVVQDAHPALRLHHGAVFSINQNGEERLVVVQEVERTHLRQFQAEDVLKAVRRAIAAEFDLQIHALVLLKPAQLPKTTSGKVQRLRCREQLLGQALDPIYQYSEIDRSEVQLPAKPLEQSPAPAAVSGQDRGEWQVRIQAWLVERVSTHLGVRQNEIQTQDPLADYGLSSLTAVRLSGELQDWLQIPLDPTILYDYPSIYNLAQALALLKTQVEILQRYESIAPLPPQQRRRRSDSEIAVIGMGCRFPGAESLEAYWQLLVNETDAITEVPRDRWDIDEYYDPIAGSPGKMNTRWGGFLERVDGFDAKFFKISVREASSMDPQQRLLLEVTWQALEQAGLVPENLGGSQTGVFIGISSNDYGRLIQDSQALPDPYSGTSHAFSIAANRLSYLMDWRGPSLAIDTACSSSLVAIHQACQSLRQQECSLAVAGGVNLILKPDLTITFSQARMMAEDGRCKTFDAKADGYVRGEGCGIVVLKRLEDAQRDGDLIFGVVKGSAVNQDGRSNGLTAPSSQAQEAVIQKALKAANVSPDRISYVEAHGTGTALGDPIEVNALKSVFGSARSLDRPLGIGSVKTNIGHLEAAAGAASFIKVILSLHYKTRLATLHCTTLNPLIDLSQSPIHVSTQGHLWESTEKARHKGISAFGFGGTNAHVIVAEAPLVEHAPAQRDRPHHLLTLSAKTQSALTAQVAQYRDFVARHPEIPLGDLCFSANTGRSHFEWRTSFLVSSKASLQHQLETTNPDRFCEVSAPALVPICVFMFEGEGNPWKMGHQLYQTQPRFKACLDRCDAILQPLWNRSLVDLLYNDAQGEGLLQEPQYAYPALFAVEYALADLWTSWGIVPDAVSGDGLGESIAACFAEYCDLSTGLKWAVQRVQLQQNLVTQALGTERFETPSLMTQFVANGAGRTPKIPVIKHPVQKREAETHGPSEQQIVPSNRPEVLIQMTAAAGEASSALHHLSQGSQHCLYSLDSSHQDWAVLLKGLATLYENGLGIRWDAVDRPYGARVENLPTYPFEQQRHWFSQKVDRPTPPLASGQGLQDSLHTLKWQEFQEQFPSDGMLPFLENGTNALRRSLPQSEFLSQLQRKSDAERRATLMHYLQQEIGRVLKLENPSSIEPRQRLFDLGLDSLVVLELKYRLEKDLGQSLSTTLLFDYPTLESLVDYLHAQFIVLKTLPNSLTQHSPSNFTEKVQFSSVPTAQLSDQEAEIVLLRELEKLNF